MFHPTAAYADACSVFSLFALSDRLVGLDGVHGDRLSVMRGC